MKEDSIVYVGVDVAKEKHAVAVAEGGRSGEDTLSGRNRDDTSGC